MLDTAIIEPRTAREWNTHYRIIRERLNRVPVPKVVFLWSPPSKPVEWPQAITINEVADDLHIPIAIRTFKRDPIVTICRATAKHFGIGTEDLMSERRHGRLPRMRQIAMYLAADITKRSWGDIASRVGGRDRTTIMHGVKRVKELIDTDAQLAADIAAIRALAVAADPGLAS